MKKILATIILISTSSTLVFTQSLLDKKITVKFDATSIKKALNKIEKKVGTTFVHSNQAALNNKISGSYQNKPVSSILKDCFINTNLTFKEIGGNITIFLSKEEKKQSPIQSTISGFVYEQQTGEALIGCSISSANGLIGTITNNFGFFSLSLPTNEKVVVSYVGYEQANFLLHKTTKRNFYLKPQATTMSEVVVTVEKRDRDVHNAKLGMINLTTNEIKALPAIGGEVDVLKAITLLPGVKQGVDGSSGFYVRGGGADQNLILLDGVPMYNPYHLWGFLSTFNADAINNIEIIKGAFPARYGGRLSSVVDITTKEGNSQQWQKDIAIGLLSAKASISGPLIKDKSSIIISGRRTYADLIVQPILKAQNSNRANDHAVKMGYNFADFNLKFNYKASGKDRFYFSGFYSRDKYFFDSNTRQKYSGVKFSNQIKRDQGWANQTASIRWNHLIGDKMFVNTTAYYSSYKYYTANKIRRASDDSNIIAEKESSSEYTSDITDITLKQDYQYFPSDKHTIKFGLGAIHHKFEPGVNSFFSKTGAVTIEKKISDNKINATESSTYIEDDFRVSTRLRMNIGIHTSAFFVQGKSYFSVQPRLSSSYDFNTRFSIKASYTKMTQYLHLLASSSIAQVSDLWVPVTKNVRPQQAHQLSLGSAIAIGKNYHLELESYYKTMKDIIDYKDGASFLDTSTSWEDKISIGKGKAYGAEAFFKKTKGKVTGWVGYTISWTNRKFKEINFGREYPYIYDRRHDISLTGSYKINKKWSLNGLWVFNTGNVITLPTVRYISPNYDGEFQASSSFPAPHTIEIGVIATGGIIEGILARNNYRLPAYHRLDITATRSKKKSWGISELTFGFTNLYNQLNPSFYVIADGVDPITRKSIVEYQKWTLFPIMPTLNYSVSF